jgi:predicted lipoprotein with Yx(FWY)xxD motif
MRNHLLIVTAAAALLGLAAHATAGTGSTGRTPTLKIRTSQFGPILFDGGNRALYAFTRDRRNGPSRCYGDCASAWPPLYAKGALVAGPGVKRSLIGTVRRQGGRLQVTYAGRPLYRYAHEPPREVRCQNVRTHGGLWLVQRASGRLVR